MSISSIEHSILPCNILIETYWLLGEANQKKTSRFKDRLTLKRELSWAEGQHQGPASYKLGLF